MEELIKVIDNGWNVKIYNQVKRMDTGKGYRDFILRVCWEARKNDKQIKCEWEGFENTKDAINNLIKVTNKQSTNK